MNQEKQLRDWQQRKDEEERLVKEYTSNSDKDHVNNYVEKLHQKEIAILNKNFYNDNNEVSDSISSSIKYLMRKKARENDPQKVQVKIEKIDYNEFINKKIMDHNNFNFDKFTKGSIKPAHFGFGNNDNEKNEKISLRDFEEKNNKNVKDVKDVKGNIKHKNNIDCEVDEKKKKEKNLKGKKVEKNVSKKKKNNTKKTENEENSEISDGNDLDKEELEKELLLSF